MKKELKHKGTVAQGKKQFVVGGNTTNGVKSEKAKVEWESHSCSPSLSVRALSMPCQSQASKQADKQVGLMSNNKTSPFEGARPSRLGSDEGMILAEPAIARRNRIPTYITA